MPKSYESLSGSGTLHEAVSLVTPNHFWALSDSLEICGLGLTTVNTGVVEKMSECLEYLSVNIGEENAEQA